MVYRNAILSVTFLLSFYLYQTFAQDVASVRWSCMPPDNQEVSAVEGNIIGLPEVGSPGFVVRDYNQGPGPDQRWWPYEDGTPVSWGNETEQVDSRWVQFAITTKSYFSFHADSFSVYLGAKGTGNMYANLYATKDTGLTAAQLLTPEPLNLVKDSDSLYHFPLNIDVCDQDTLYIRIYPYYSGAPSTSKYLYVRDAFISGYTESESYKFSVLWPLTDPAVSGTGLAPVVNGPALAANEWLNNMEINHYTGPGNSQRVRILGNEWPANQLGPIDTVFIQFNMEAREGLTGMVDSVKLKMAAASINTMKAEIYYASKADFSDSVRVDYQTGNANNYLPIDSMITVAFQPGAPLNPDSNFYIRIYPWVDNEPNVRTGKYVCLKDVYISGHLQGTVIIDLPEVKTGQVTNISTTFATADGNVSNDGGSPVTARGVCWNISGGPTIADAHTVEGEGSGPFISLLQGLEPNTTYYLRAYATNAAGTAYGEEKQFTTLAELTVPTVITSEVTEIMVEYAHGGGQVLAWGGDTVMSRGVCWNNTGNPTIKDHKTEDGVGLGSFSSFIYPLTANTTYYVRAYATNKVGTGYGEVVSFTTQNPAPTVEKIVAQDGSGDYTSVQEAFNDIPDYYTGKYIIRIKPGTYYEKLFLDRRKVNVILVGEDPKNTILTYDDYAGKAGGTSKSYSVSIEADDFVAMNITFQNTVKNDGSVPDQQAVALRVNGDRQSYFNCRLLGYQDTYYTWGGRGTGRIYMNHCYIEGSVDFIFGRDIVVFDSCEMHINREGGSLTAASTDPEAKFGYVFRDCRITADDVGFDGRSITSFILGRPWQGAPRTVFIRCEEPASLDPKGWSTWNVLPALYAEYQCYGPGSDISQRISISRQLTDQEAVSYTLGNIFSKESHPDFLIDWIPSKPEIVTTIHSEGSRTVLPKMFRLYPNFPNPFNPNTTIQFDIPIRSRVNIELYNMLGEKVQTVMDEWKNPGQYHLSLQFTNRPSGVYFLRLRAADFNRSIKMLLLK